MNDARIGLRDTLSGCEHLLAGARDGRSRKHRSLRFELGEGFLPDAIPPVRMVVENTKYLPRLRAFYANRVKRTI